MVKVKEIKLTTNSISKTNLVAVLTIAGSDSSGGAGIEADLKTLTAHGVYGLTCISALTAQNTQLVKSFEKTPQPLLESILELNFNDFLFGYDHEPPLKVVKTGMLTREAINALTPYLSELNKFNVKLVLDPVMVSTSGSTLFKLQDLKYCADHLFKHAYLITPNFIEAQALVKTLSNRDIEKIQSLDDLLKFVKDVQTIVGCENVLVKGGHLPWDINTGKPTTDADTDTNSDFADHIVVKDVLYESKSDTFTIYESEYINSEDTHGTGCTLASSISANIAKGYNLSDAIPLSIDYIHQGMKSMGQKLGHGNGPLNHINNPTTNINSIIASKSHPFNHKDVLQYFKEHPKIKDNWKAYTQHEFIRQVVHDKLPFDRFLYFLKQDYYYLINYAQIHALAASVAPTYNQTHSESLIIGNIVNEIERHKQKLCDEYDIDYERDKDLDIELQPGSACLAYCDYLLKMGKSQDFIGIKVALAPCLHGYAEAGIYGKQLRESNKDQTISAVYESWLGDYSSEWYLNAHEEGKQALNELFRDEKLTQERIDELVDIFNTVTRLEEAFWDECLERVQ
ncbi:Phosphomethylpyrimidine kinase [Scheffersomyces amazonensis]|uniref:Phosphomethylpyrimidine kinase n=1 Tax=Scheffersomyces amazonensis TaxID=1078765 RepID=UPI00315D417E